MSGWRPLRATRRTTAGLAALAILAGLGAAARAIAPAPATAGTDPVADTAAPATGARTAAPAVGAGAPAVGADAPAPGSSGAAAPASGDCARRLSDRLADAPPGATVTVPACIYRERVVIAKPVTLIGTPGAEIRGSDVWQDFTPESGTWRSGQTVPLFAADGQCKPGGPPRCHWPEQVFVNGTPQVQVAAGQAPGPGQFSVDVDRRVRLGSDPSGKTVEVTTRDAWIVGAADGVTIAHLVARHAASDAAQGALSLRGASHWRIDANTLSDAHGAVVGLGGGSDIRLTGNDITRGGGVGIRADGGAAAVIANNRLHDNNSEAFDTSERGGALKVTAWNGLTVDSNEISGNNGAGLWFDAGCGRVRVVSNRVSDNTGAGIAVERSDGATVVGNTVWANGLGGGQSRAAGVAVTNSRDVDVSANTILGNGHGVAVAATERGIGSAADAAHWTAVRGVSVAANTIAMTSDGTTEGRALSWAQSSPGGALFDPASHNRVTDNRFSLQPAEVAGRPWFTWGGRSFWRLADFNAATTGIAGRYLFDEELHAAHAAPPQTPSRSTPLPAPGGVLPTPAAVGLRGCFLALAAGDRRCLHEWLAPLAAGPVSSR